MKYGDVLSKLILVLVTLIYLTVWMPVIVFGIFSFSKDRIGIRWAGFTLKWYSDLFNNVIVMDAFKMSLIVAVITVVVATIAGTLAAYGLYKYKFRGKGVLRVGILLPLTIPWVVAAGALLLFFTRVIYIPLGYPSIVIAHISFSFPLATFVVLGRMQRIDWTLEEASADLGASKFTTWRKIILPLLLPAIIASAALIFPWSFNDLTITYFVSGVGNTTLPVYIFSLIKVGVSPIVNATGVILVIIPIIALLLLNFLRKKEVA